MHQPAPRSSSRRPCNASAVSSRNRDGTCSVVRRRSPRGNPSTRDPAVDASAARSARSSEPIRSARSTSCPSSGARSLSLRSGSSRGAAGNTPSAIPHTNRWSRSAPSAKPTGPTRIPSPSRPIRSRAAASSSSSVRRNTAIVGAASTESRPASRSSAPSTRSAASCSSTGHGARRRSSPIQRRTSRRAQPALPDHDAGTPAGSRSAASASTNSRKRGNARLFALGPCSVAELRGVGVEEHVPLLEPADDAGTPRALLPRGTRGGMALAVEHRGRGQQREQGVATEAFVGQREEPQEGAAEHGIVERAHRRSVVRDPCQFELLVEQARVGLVARVEDGHPFQRHAAAHRGDDRAHHGADLVVRIGGRHDRRPDRRGDVSCVATFATEQGGTRHDLGVGGGPTRQPDDHHARHELTDGARQSRRRTRESLRKVRDEHAELVDRRPPGLDELGRGGHQVVLGVPVRRELLLHGAVDAHHLARASSAARAASTRRRRDR